MANTEQSRGNQQTRLRHDLGAMRTMMAADRTLMAWIRTTLSLLSFGFAIYKVLQEFEQQGKPLPHENTPRNVGTIEYCQTIHDLRQDYHLWYIRPALIMAVIILVSGLILVVGILDRLV
jgi:putative membrane protein